RDEAARARRAFAFAAAVALQTRLLQEKRTRAPRPGGAYAGVERDLAAYRAALPFPLTADQERALGEAARDLAAPDAMIRRLTGDGGRADVPAAGRRAPRPPGRPARADRDPGAPARAHARRGRGRARAPAAAGLRRGRPRRAERRPALRTADRRHAPPLLDGDAL